MEKKKIIKVKNNIFINGQQVIQKGIYDYDSFVKNYPVFNTTNTDYFSVEIKEIIPFGTKVVYGGQIYYVVDHLDQSIQSDNIVYYISKSTTDKASRWKKVYGNHLILAVMYWFVNSKGAICQTSLEEDPSAAGWRKKIGNFFDTFVEAKQYKDRLMIIN